MNDRKKLESLRRVFLTASVIFLIIAFISLAGVIRSNLSRREPEAEHPVNVEHRVLFISSYTPVYFAYSTQEKGLDESLYKNGIEYDVIYMDSKNYASEEDTAAFYALLRTRLTGDRNYEAVIVGDDDALKFVTAHYTEFFQSIPIVFFGINDMNLALAAEKNPHITGFYETDYQEATIDIAKRIFPKTERFVALHDNTSAGRADNEIFHIIADKYPDYEFTDIDTSTLSEGELIKRLENLSEGTVLLYMTAYTDGEGNNYSMRSRTQTIVDHTSVPIFRNYLGGEGMGILGGVYMDMEAQCRAVGERVSEILSGADIKSYELNIDTPCRVSFDYSLLMDYGINTRLLPKETVYYNKPETFMSRYGGMFPSVGSVTAALLTLAIGMFFSVRLGKLDTKELIKSRDRLEKSQEELKYLAEHDEFLNILNRRTATAYLRKNLTQFHKYSIVMSDLDGFKGVNESYGHHQADEVLKYMASHLSDMAAKNDWMLARYGGDEFLLMMPGEELAEEHPIVKGLLDFFRMPIPVGDNEIKLSASLGISNSDGITTPDEHIINAEAAMYEAKARGRDGAFVYGDEMKAKVREENVIKDKLLEAFENDGFFMLYQPQIDSMTKKVSGYEALVRMKAPGMYPGVFIPIAEKNGWIWRIGRITTELVIKQLAKWRDEGRELHPVSVNFSSNQLNDSGYLDFVKEQLEKYNVPAGYLEIEITEGIFLDRTAEAENLFNSFKEMGFRLLMDDFGTGYSSLGYLTYIPVDVIKLDKSLVDAYLVDGKDAFIKDVIQLVHDLDKEMIIEGVEEKWQFERLREFKADTIQGYYFSKPIPPEEAILFEVGEDK
ncbi:MAG: GGDEF domain-containing protein [Lachnospiraceae bacterium]|nr:GGDEF domain-containing protein [Lachnospiraceae bacterium]